MVPEHQKDQTSHLTDSTHPRPVLPGSDTMYCTSSSEPLRHHRLSTLIHQVPDSFSLDVVNKVTHPVKPNTEETCNNHYEKFRDFIHSKVGPNSCFQLSLIVEYFNLLTNKNFRSSTLKSVRSVSKVSLQRYFEDYDMVNDPGIGKII